MASYFELSTRVLTCDNCGAPITVPIEGGQVPCQYCRAVVIVEARPALEPVARSAADDDAARLERLRAGDLGPQLPPAHVLKLGPLNEARLAPALALFQTARKRLKEGDSPEADQDLYYLTVLFSNYYQKKNDYLHLRAFLESALEAARTARTRQLLCGTLARTAARLGEKTAAEQWFDKCDPYSEDPTADSDYRATRAFLAILRGDFADAIAVLGERYGDLPIANDSVASCALYRAHALEMLHGPDVAAEELVRAAKASPANYFTMKSSRSFNQRDGLELCPKSFELARSQLAWTTTNLYAMPLGCGLALAFLVGLLALFEVGSVVVAVVAVVGGILCVMFARHWIAVGRD